MLLGDTIAAISTPPGRGGIGIVRLSGPAALETAIAVFRAHSPNSSNQPNRAQVGSIVDPNDDSLIDQAVLTYFKSPHSYTGEDVVELSCHGSPVILGRLLALVCSRGVRLAEPGEFTFRAFMNRRIDLAQAQAVRELINAQTEYQAQVAIRQIKGSISARLAPAKQSLVDVIVHLESAIEFVEDDISPQTKTEMISKIDQIVSALDEAAASFNFGRHVAGGFDLAIVGRPNVGKSSVFNRLIGRDRAIVTELPGTTRDTLFETTSISGVPVRLVDTAGIRETSDRIESIGITRSRAAIADADVSVLVLDASEPLNDDDIRLLNEVPEQRRIIVYNKIDLLGKNEAGFLQSDPSEVLSISALTGVGFKALTDTIFTQLAGETATERDGLIVTDARQHLALCKAIEQLRGASTLMSQGELDEIVLLRLRSALSAVGEITGETLTDDILNQIFATFCIGK